jgi:molybdopterin/thiamine biosynthesis adenylyltransferase
VFRQVLVAGIGALGSEVVKNLGLMGCEVVFIADADVIEEKNIARSVLLREGAVVGKSKVSCALDRLQSWFPQTRWSGAPVEIADVEPEHFFRAEVLFSCVDTDLARAEIAALAARYKLPICDAGLGGVSTSMGRVSWFPGNETAACFACLLPGRRRAELFSVWESDIHACWASEPKEKPAWTSTATMASIVAGLQVEIAASAAEKATEAFSVHLDLDREQLCQTIQYRRSADCPLHIEVSGVPFPICTLAECRMCGRQFSPNRRIAWVRRWGACPSCQSREVIVRESLREEVVECGI